MSMKKKANDLARVAVQKGHIEAVRRLQQTFELELRAAGVKGEEVNKALAVINANIGFYEDKIGGEYDNALFEMEDM
ncbi:hypothetical protein [Enterobacter hormaechei]|uniref:hypothetical protein n=1 Tax=Enterobacter hormaechei TaxID=158836 RepID=UPI003076060B